MGGDSLLVVMQFALREVATARRQRAQARRPDGRCVERTLPCRVAYGHYGLGEELGESEEQEQDADQADVPLAERRERHGQHSPTDHPQVYGSP